MIKYTLEQVKQLNLQIRVTSTEQANTIATVNGYERKWNPYNPPHTFYVKVTDDSTNPSWSSGIDTHGCSGTIDFEQLILKNNKIVYKPKNEEFKQSACKLLGVPDFDVVRTQSTIETLRKLQVLDLWFDEVNEDELPEILGYKATWEKGIIKYGCQSFTESQLKSLLEIMKQNCNPSISITIGSSQYTLTPELINKALNKIK
jgi:hypothetical protein